VCDCLGIEFEVIEGSEEVSLLFVGVMFELFVDDVVGLFVVVDIGGGFIEVVWGEWVVEFVLLVDVGCVWFIEWYLYDDLFMYV